MARPNIAIEKLDILGDAAYALDGVDAILVTDKQIADLMAEAAEAGDLDQVALCNEALAGSQGAREECAKVIESARKRLP